MSMLTKEQFNQAYKYFCELCRVRRESNNDLMVQPLHDALLLASLNAHYSDTLYNTYCARRHRKDVFATGQPVGDPLDLSPLRGVSAPAADSADFILNWVEDMHAMLVWEPNQSQGGVQGSQSTPQSAQAQANQTGVQAQTPAQVVSAQQANNPSTAPPTPQGPPNPVSQGTPPTPTETTSRVGNADVKTTQTADMSRTVVDRGQKVQGFDN